MLRDLEQNWLSLSNYFLPGIFFSGIFFFWHLFLLGLDRLAEQGTSPLPDTTRLVNPAWCILDSQVRSAAGKLTRQKAAFAAHILQPIENTPSAAARHEASKGQITFCLASFCIFFFRPPAKRRATALFS